MDARAAKLALARKKLKDHQSKKNHETIQKNDVASNNELENDITIIEQDSSVKPIHKDSLEYKQNENTSECGIHAEAYATEYKHNECTISSRKPELNATEFLISSKRNLEMQMMDLQAKNKELENNFIATSDKYEISCHKVNTLENELKNINLNYNAATEQLQMKNLLIEELNSSKGFVLEEKNNLQEQLEFTKTILAAKETENDSLHSQLFNIQSQLDATQLQLQQLTSGGHDPNKKHSQETLRHENEMLLNKVTSLEQQIKSQSKDFQQINSHYEHYVGELNEQLKSVTRKNEDLNRELQNLTNRENGLIEQISEMEIRIQNYNRSVFENSTSKTDNGCNMNDFKELQDKYEKMQENFQHITNMYEKLQSLYSESNAKIEELSQAKEVEFKQSNEVSLQKLNADITSDKVAAQRATEQNKKLKNDLRGLEEAVVKMTKDKLELTEKLTAEKFLNRELTIKLAEIDEKANNLHITLKAKDDEMIRLQATYRDLERIYEELKQAINSNVNSEYLNNNDSERTHDESKNEANYESKNDYSTKTSNNRALIECLNSSASIPKGDAMLKLQERFLKIMEEVADLSDEKHRLEHIIMQLQNETDTICEYVALYQQQRSLLKRRDEERSAQIKLFQSECNRLEQHLDELTGILMRFAEDKELTTYFQIETKHEDIKKVLSLLANLKTSSLLDANKAIEFNNFYPCSCCSGQLIDV